MSKLTYIAKNDLLAALGREQFTEEETKQLEGDLGQEFAFLLQFKNAGEADKQQFLDDFDQDLLKDISLSLSSRFYVEDVPYVEGEEELHDMYRDAVTQFMNCVGESFHDDIDTNICKNLPPQNKDYAYNDSVLNNVTVDLEKLRALDRIQHEYPLAMTNITTVNVPTDSVGYFQYMADRDACKQKMHEAGLYPDFCAGNYSTSRNGLHPLYQKKDYYSDTFLAQTESGLTALNQMGIDINQNGATADGLMNKIYKSREKFAMQMITDIIGSYDTLGDALTDFVTNKNMAKILNVNGVAKYSEVALNILYQCRVKGDNDVAVTQAFHAQRGAMFANYQVEPGFFQNHIDALAKLNNMADLPKAVFIFEGKKQPVPQASNLQYMKNLNTLAQTIKDKMKNPEEIDNFDDYSEALKSINNVAVRKYNSLSFFHKLFHPIISREMKKTAVDMEKFINNDLVREHERVYLLQCQKATDSKNDRKHEIANQLDRDFEKDFSALGYKGLATSFLRKFDLVRMSLVGKLPNETIFELPDVALSENQAALVQTTITEMKQAAKNGDKAYFDAMVDRTGEFIKDIKLPDFRNGNMTDIAAITGDLNERARFAINFTQIQPSDQYAKYAKAHPEVDAAEMTLESMGKFTNDLFMPVGKLKDLSKDENEPLTVNPNQATTIVNAAEVVGFFSKNATLLSGKKLTDVKLNPQALQHCGGFGLQQLTSKSSKNPAVLNEAIKFLQGEPNTFKPCLHDEYNRTATAFAQKAAAPQTKQKLVEREPAFKNNFTQTKTQEKKTTAPTQTQTVTKSEPTIADK